MSAWTLVDEECRPEADTCPPLSVFNHMISFEGDPVANQLASGRCWLFALTNVVRIFTTRKYKLSKFQLSQVRQRIPESRETCLLTLFCVQSYLFFYDHLSKANWFLEQVLDLVDEKLESRKMQFLFSNMPAQDGGKLLWLFELTAL